MFRLTDGEVVVPLCQYIALNMAAQCRSVQQNCISSDDEVGRVHSSCLLLKSIHESTTPSIKCIYGASRKGQLPKVATMTLFREGVCMCTLLAARVQVN